MKLTDKVLRNLLRDRGYLMTNDSVENHAAELAAEVLRLRQDKRVTKRLLSIAHQQQNVLLVANQKLRGERKGKVK